MLLDQDPVFIGSGLGAAVLQMPPRKADPTTELVIAGPQRLAANVPFALPESADRMIRRYGRRYYESMLTDPAVSSSYLALKLGILEGGIHVLPNKRPPVYRRKSGEHQLNPGRMRSMSPEESEAAEAAEFCQRLIDRLDDFTAILVQWLDSMAYGVKLAEVVYRVAGEGLDKGQYVWDRIDVKPDWAWRFVVNSVMQVQGILTWSPQTSGFLVLATEKFHWLSWLPQNNDPRGTSQLRAAAEWWNLKTQIKPLYYQHLSRWGSPGLDYQMAEGDTATYPATDEHGNILVGSPGISAEEHHRRQLEMYQNGGTFTHPHGSVLNVIEPQKEGGAFLEAFRLFDEQITMSILLSTAASMSNGGGDSEGRADAGQNAKGLAVGYGRGVVQSGLRKLFREALVLNKGAEYAERNLPEVIVGQLEGRARADIWNAVANLQRAGFLGDSQRPAIDAAIDLPERDAEADAEADAARAPKPAPDGARAGQEKSDQKDGPDAGKGNKT